MTTTPQLLTYYARFARRSILKASRRSLQSCYTAMESDQITGDRYAGEWVRQSFQKRGIHYIPSELPKSGLYLDLLPKLNSRTIRLVDNQRLVNQIAALERRTSRGGKDSIDHPPQAHDDLANVVAGVASVAVSQNVTVVTDLFTGRELCRA